MIFTYRSKSSRLIVWDCTRGDVPLAKFVSATLRNHITGSLAIISRSLMNRTDFDLLSYLVYRIAKTILEFLEMEIIVGTSGKLEGLITAKVRVTSASVTAITADDLIDLQMSIPEVY